VPGAPKTLTSADLDKIADHFRHGLTIEDVCRHENLSRRQVYYRLDLIKQRLAKETGDVAWLEANVVALGRGWFAEPVRAHLTGPSKALGG